MIDEVNFHKIQAISLLIAVMILWTNLMIGSFGPNVLAGLIILANAIIELLQ